MPVLPPPQHIMHLLTRAERLLARRLKTVLDAEGHTLDAWRVLSLLSDGTGHHMTEIAEHAFLPAATLTKLVDRLVDDNLVYRRIDPVDRRRIRAYLTPRGRDVYQRVHRSVQASWDHLATTTHDDDSLGELLARLIDALDRQPDPTAQTVHAGSAA
jgi:MarR family transcriptional regulator, organic hydroperoxide resistance regulator